ncbi:MAG TPA: hypothetical protein VF951_05325, partial [Streptosporangiaceae bacterium]
LMEALIAGQIDAIGSDHCCFTREQKYRHSDVRQAPFGLPGVEIRLRAIVKTCGSRSFRQFPGDHPRKDVRWAFR